MVQPTTSCLIYLLPKYSVSETSLLVTGKVWLHNYPTDEFTSLFLGYNAPQNLQHYALYLDSRIRAYRDLKHDAIRVQAETNRDMRLNHSLEEDMAYTSAPKSASTKSKGPQRSKTIMGRKLRVMTVEKGLLRETKTVQSMIDTLVECRVRSHPPLSATSLIQYSPVLSRRSGGRINNNCPTHARQGLTHPFPGGE
jgi:hypothetical protein